MRREDLIQDRPNGDTFILGLRLGIRLFEHIFDHRHHSRRTSTQCSCQFKDYANAWLIYASFDQTDKVPLDLGSDRKLLLGEPSVAPQST